MKYAALILILLAGGLSRTVCAQSPLQNSGIDTSCPAIQQVLQNFVQDGTMAGAVAMVARKDRIESVNCAGYADLSARAPMRPDHLFWIASMTKPMTAVAVLMLQDEGKLSVDDPVEKHLPEFKGQWMLQEKSERRQVLVPPPRPITVRDLLTHTSGLNDLSSPRWNATLAELVMGYAQRPLKFEPGSRWEYSNAGINTLGRIVEVVAGQKFEDFLQARLLDPLGMAHTTFWPTPAQCHHLAKSYKPAPGGKTLEETEVYFVQGPISDRNRTPYPAGGLYSTAADLTTFYQMMLNSGVSRGKRLLSASAVQQMTATQTGDIKTGFVEGMSFGFGFAVVKSPQGVTAMLSRGTFGHGGAYATQSWADPHKDLILVLMIQRAGFPNGDNSPVRMAFQQAAMKAFAERAATK